jgi:hypothetical protein
MDFGLIALIVVAAGKTLDYVAPRTKTTVDDKVRSVFQWAIGLLPFVNKDLAGKVEQAKSEPAVVVARKAGGVEVRDHRSK